jgi:hypothetical protein
MMSLQAVSGVNLFTIDMKAEEAIQLKIPAAGTHPSREYYIDTFRHPYVRFGSTFTMPSITLTEIQYDEAQAIIDTVSPFIGDFISGCYVLPISRPRKDSTYLQFMRPMEWQGNTYLYLFKLLSAYMGGASEEEMQRGTQDHSPYFQTDRIYFHARILPVTSVDLIEGNFEPRKIPDAMFQVQSPGTAPGARHDLWSTILFDEVDFSSLNELYSRRLDFGKQWSSGRLFYPLLIDHLTIGLNVMAPYPDLLERILPYFHRAFENLLHGENARWTEEDVRFWSTYTGSVKLERTESRMGNPHWKVLNHMTLDLFKSL